MGMKKDRATQSPFSQSLFPVQSKKAKFWGSVLYFCFLFVFVFNLTSPSNFGLRPTNNLCLIKLKGCFKRKNNM